VFMRLMYCSFLVTPIRRIPAGSVAGDSGFDRDVPPYVCSGAFGSENGIVPSPACLWSDSGDRAPDHPVSPAFWSSTTSVDTAGWTEVVIQREPQVLSDVIIGYSIAEVNASINYVAGAVDDGPGLDWSEDGEFFGDTVLCRGYPEVNGCSFSCSNNNEVTI
jgi:hypothetical protein